MYKMNLQSFKLAVIWNSKLVYCKSASIIERAKWPMEAVLIYDFCSVKRMRVFDSPWMGH